MTAILYVGELGIGATSQDRAETLAAMGASVDMIGPTRPAGTAGRIDWMLSRTIQVSASISRLNRMMVERVLQNRYDIVWIDKGWMIKPESLHAIRQLVSTIVLFNNDNPWGYHERGMWRLLIRCIPYFDEIIVPKYSVVRCYERHGAKRVSVADFGYAPDKHFPADQPVEKKHELCFIGTPIEDGGNIRPGRVRQLIAIAGRLPGRVSVFGHGWRAALKGKEHLFKEIADGIYGPGYRETIWASKINIAFITKGNWEETSHKAFEIAACGGCLLCERSSRMEQSFEEGREALFFTTVDDAVEAAGRLLSDTAMCQGVASAGYKRAISSGYDNRSRLEGVVSRSPVLRRYFQQAVSNDELAIGSATAGGCGNGMASSPLR